MKNRYFFLIAVVIYAASVVLPPAYADENDTRDLLKEGLLGAGAGAVGGAASGAKGKDLWKGALAGAGVNIVGGALLDSLSGEKVENVQQVDSSSPRDAYSDGYQEGYQNGYKAGYTDGYKDGSKESMQKAQ
jgi:hypothetical protein